MANHSHQPLLIDVLLDPSRYPHPAKTVRLLETHISWVLLAGRFAYKIKKPVDLGFLDFTDLNKRRFFCQEEIRLNRRLAPQLYLEAIAIGGSQMQPLFGAEPAFEYAVKMRRFPTVNLLDRLVTRDRLTAQHIDSLATTLAHFHASLPPADPDSAYGTPEAVAAPARQNFLKLAALLEDIDQETLKNIQTASEQEFSIRLPLFEQRRKDGFIRECHGDLHLGNIVLIKNVPVAFDGIEFDPKLRWIDVVNEIAFLIMDLQHRGRADLAFRFLNAYLESCGDYQGLGVLRYYLGYRAMVRAKITAIRASQTASDTSMAECRSYLTLAGSSLQKGRPILIITHGLPGCGKTTVSQAVLEKLHAIRLRSDVERKRLFKLAALESSGGSIYDPQATQLTYGRLLHLTRELLELGFPVIVDAAFLKHAERRQFATLAREARLPFMILSVRTETSLLRQRIQQRLRTGNDASEADLAVLEKLQTTCEPLRADETSVTVEFINNASVAELANQAIAWDRLNELLKQE
ncbi:MAG: AAA family ATPase [Methylococcaceae bacterium]|nr:AAA family ATPase [Methylococcaceae bacterium]